MDAGTHGPLGAAAVRLAVAASSRDRECVKGLSSVVNLALVIRESRGAATRKDAPVGDCYTKDESGHTTIQFNKQRKYLSFRFSL